MELTTALIALIGAVLLAELLRSHVSIEHAVARWKGKRALLPAPSTQKAMPVVTVIRPVKGKDPGLNENLQAGLRHDYPAPVQTLFVLDDDRDPAFNLVKAATHHARERGDDVSIILAGEPPAHMTGKLHAMIKGLEHARGEIIAFADSDTRPHPRLLRELVEPLIDQPDIGATFAPVVVTTPPETAGDVGYALMLNGLYGAAARLVAGPNGELPFIMGQFMAMRRETLDRIGGLEGTVGELVDDMNIGLRMAAAGFKNVMVNTPMSIVQAGLSIEDFVGVYRRWIAFSRSGLPWSFKFPVQLKAGLYFALLAVAVLGVILSSLPVFLVGLTGVLFAGHSVNHLHRAFGGHQLTLGQRFVIHGLMLASPYIYLRVLTGRQINWRGRIYRLDPGARLHDKLEPPAHPPFNFPSQA